MKIIYMSCHGILEYDEVKLLTEMGHDVFCIGDYGSNERPLIKGRDRDCSWFDESEANEVISCGQCNLPDFAIDRCDAIISMHVSEWLTKQWDKIKHKKCYLRLIGQHFNNLGQVLRPYSGLRVIPYWPTDLILNGLFPDQVTNVVRFYKDENEFTGWEGYRKIVLTTCNEITRGNGACHANEYKNATHNLPRLLLGKKNRMFGDFTGRVPYWLLKEMYRDCKVYFYIGTEPATYTLNLIEAMMTGMPIVAYDSGASAVKELAGFASKDVYELNEVLEELLEADRERLTPYSNREKAIQLFGKQQAMDSWKAVINE